jgi:hypothetical protein
MSIKIGNDVLNYKTNEDKYIITYISAEYNVELDLCVDMIFNAIFPYYHSRNLFYSNVCGANAEFICKNLKIQDIKLGKLIITNWIKKKHKNLQSIESVYGPIAVTIGASYHALAYLEKTIENKTYYIAFETTSCQPYKLQFYIGSDYEEFKKIIKIRYQCKNFKISFDCPKCWIDIAFKTKTKTENTRKRKQKTSVIETEKLPNLKTKTKKPRKTPELEIKKTPENETKKTRKRKNTRINPI